jgi:hypothetical protein
MCRIGTFIGNKIPGSTGQRLSDRDPHQILKQAFSTAPEQLPIFFETLRVLEIGIGRISETTTIGELMLMVTESTIQSISEYTGHSPRAIARLYQQQGIGFFSGNAN